MNTGLATKGSRLHVDTLPSGDWITVNDAAQLLGRCRETVFWRIRKGFLNTMLVGNPPRSYVLRSEIEQTRNNPRSCVLPEDWISPAEAAKILGIPISGVYARVRTGELTRQLQLAPGSKHIGRQYFSRREVEANRIQRPAFAPRKQNPYLFNPSSEECAYLAGLVDGEGTISGCRNRNGGQGAYHARLSVANTDFRMLEWIVSHFGGTIHRTEKGHWSTLGQWITSCTQALAIL